MLSETMRSLTDAPTQTSAIRTATSVNVIDAAHLSKRYRRYLHRDMSLKGWVLDWLRGRRDQYVEFQALHDISFSVPHGQVVGIVGKNGAGKSTLLRILAGVAEPDTGSLAVRGRIIPLLELGAGFVAELTGRRNVYLYGALLGLKRAQITEQLQSIIEFSEIGDFIDTPVKHYSSGMYVRLAFAVTAHLDPDILLLDEVLAVGDVAYQAKCRARLDEFRRAGKTIVLVSHNAATILEICDRALLIHQGELIADDDPEVTLTAYQRLLSS
jgi:ABC-type polysaccharide/polyol phosphate transport system ATPase subunit